MSAAELFLKAAECHGLEVENIQIDLDGDVSKDSSIEIISDDEGVTVELVSGKVH